MARRDWPDHETSALRDEIAAGLSPAEIARRHGRPLGSVRCKIQREEVGPLQQVRAQIRQARPVATDESPAVAEWQARRDAAVAEVPSPQSEAARRAALHDWLRPVELPPVEPPRVRYKPSPCWVVSSDHHWPLQDPRVEAIILQVVEALKPRGYILNGDGADLLALSRYPKDMRHGKSWPLRDEQVGAKSWWRALHERGQAWGMELYETEANHSGNGPASRWRRWLNDNAGELFGLEGFEEDLTYARYFHPADVPVRLVDEVVIARDLRVRHGEIVRKHGGYSARAHGDKWQASVLHGHTHRIGSSIKRRPGIPGVRPDEFIRTFETGCACRLDADYCPGGDWANGFAIIRVDEATNGYGVEMVHVIDGRAVVNALGGTVAA